MTVKSDPDNPGTQNNVQSILTLCSVLYTITNATSAFQSGTDEAVETQHWFAFTIGNLNKDNDFDVHFRMTISDNHCEIDAHEYIEMEVDPFKRNTRIPKATRDHIRTELHKVDITRINKDHMPDFTDEMANVTRTYSTVGKSKFKQPALGWYDDEPYYLSSKKNEDALDITQRDIADEFVNAVLLVLNMKKFLLTTIIIELIRTSFGCLQQELYSIRMSQKTYQNSSTTTTINDKSPTTTSTLKNRLKNFGRTKVKRT